MYWLSKIVIVIVSQYMRITTYFDVTNTTHSPLKTVYYKTYIYGYFFCVAEQHLRWKSYANFNKQSRRHMRVGQRTLGFAEWRYVTHFTTRKKTKGMYLFLRVLECSSSGSFIYSIQHYYGYTLSVHRSIVCTECRVSSGKDY